MDSNQDTPESSFARNYLVSISDTARSYAQEQVSLMPLQDKRIVVWDSYCSAPPLTSSPRVLLAPRLSRAEEARRPRMLLRPVKAGVRESEDSVEYAFDDEEFGPKPVKEEPVVKVEQDPRQPTIWVDAISIGQPTSAASTSSDGHSGPSGVAYRTQGLSTIPSGQLGPADPPKGRSYPKGSKSRPRIEPNFDLPVPPERAAATKAQAEMESTSKQ